MLHPTFILPPAGIGEKHAKRVEKYDDELAKKKAETGNTEAQIGKNPVSTPSYQPLPTATSVRLFKIERPQLGRSTSSRIAGELIVVDLDKKPKYDALSYTWGDPCSVYHDLKHIRSSGDWKAPIFTIKCDGRDVHVATNLFMALAVMRWLPAEFNPPRMGAAPFGGFLWIDALCINQQDKDEVNQQLALMSRIYGQASHTFFWLGGELESSERVASHLQEFHHALPRWFQNEQGFRRDVVKFDLRSQKQDGYRQFGLTPISYEGWSDIVAFLNRSWFFRVWILQEAILSRHGVFLCGQIQTPVELLLGARMFLGESGWYDQALSMLSDVYQRHSTSTRDQKAAAKESGGGGAQARLYETSPLDGVKQSNPHVMLIAEKSRLKTHRDNDYWSFLDESSWSSGGLPLEKLLITTRIHGAFEPKDKVFALLSISGNATQSMLTDFQLNYNVKPPEVYIYTARYILQKKKNLSILSHISADTSTMEIPSWVPDFSISLGHSCSIDPAPMIDGFRDSLQPYRAAKGLPPFQYRDQQGHELQVSGFKVATIDRIASWAKFQIGEIAHVLEALPSETVVPPQRLSRFDVFWRTLCFDIDNYDTWTHPAPTTQGAYVARLLQFVLLVHHCKNELSFQMMGDGIRATFKELPQEEVFRRARRGFIGGASVKDTFSPKDPDFLSLYTALRELLTPLAIVDDGQTSPPPVPESALPDVEVLLGSYGDVVEPKSRNEKEVRDTIQTRMKTRVLFATSESPFLGAGPQSLTAGDEVWILSGCNVPIVLRDAGDGKRRVVGECYVHGIMHGEAVNMQPNASVQTIMLV